MSSGIQAAISSAEACPRRRPSASMTLSSALYGTDSCWKQRPASFRTSGSSPADSRNRCTSVLFPIPDDPRTSATTTWPARASSRAARSFRSSASRPTKGPAPAARDHARSFGGTAGVGCGAVTPADRPASRAATARAEGRASGSRASSARQSRSRSSGTAASIARGEPAPSRAGSFPVSAWWSITPSA
ncbi:MAG: hypothetical protein QM820_32745 [Minicystis sp.]